MPKEEQDRLIVKKGEKPPETIEREGKTYKPKWHDITTEADRKRGEEVYTIASLGDPVEDE